MERESDKRERHTINITAAHSPLSPCASLLTLLSAVFILNFHSRFTLLPTVHLQRLWPPTNPTRIRTGCLLSHLPTHRRISDVEPTAYRR